jgi:hypothetical protein
MRRLLASMLAAAGLVLGVPATAAAEDTPCTGVLGPVVVDNLFVPSGEFCVLEGTQVRGSVRVEEFASLFGDAANIRGNLLEERFAFVVVDEFQIGGSVLLNAAFAHLHMRGGSVGDSVMATRDSSFSSVRGAIGGNVQCGDCEFLDLDSATAGGNVQIAGGGGGVFRDNRIAGDLAVARASFDAFAQFLLRNEIGGDLRLENSSGPMLLDGNQVRGDLQVFGNTPRGRECDFLEGICVTGLRIARNTSGGNGQVWKNTGPTEISQNAIADSLQCRENDPQPVGGGNVARKKEGQCAVL